MVKLWAIFHILLGGICLPMGLMILVDQALDMHGKRHTGLTGLVFESIGLIIMLAGLSYVFSGFFLWSSSNKVLGKLVLSQGMTVVFLSIVCIACVLEIGATFTFKVSASFLSLMLVELCYFLSRWSDGRGLMTGRS